MCKSKFEAIGQHFCKASNNSVLFQKVDESVLHVYYTFYPKKKMLLLTVVMIQGGHVV